MPTTGLYNIQGVCTTWSTDVPNGNVLMGKGLKKVFAGRFVRHSIYYLWRVEYESNNLKQHIIIFEAVTKDDKLLKINLLIMS